MTPSITHPIASSSPRLRVRRCLRLAFAVGAAFLILAVPASAGTPDQSQTSATGTSLVRGTIWWAQTFTAGLTGELDEVQLYLGKEGSPGPLTVEIRTASAGVPTGTILASATVPEATVTGPMFYSVPINPTAPSSQGTQYAIVVHADSSSQFNDFLWYQGGGDPYPGGNSLSSLNGGQSWMAATVDQAFKTFVAPPTAVTILSFSTQASPSGVELRWRTGQESGLLGFNVYRGRSTKLNRTLIAAHAIGSMVGGRYRFRDASARRGVTYTYRLQAVSLGGTRAWIGTAVAGR